MSISLSDVSTRGGVSVPSKSPDGVLAQAIIPWVWHFHHVTFSQNNWNETGQERDEFSTYH
ncbi:MAG TPA: hypothetical protein VF142_14745, partial [Longimicrobium sp.]